MMKLLNQFEQVESATPFALSEDGNISIERVSNGGIGDHWLSSPYRMALPKARDPMMPQN
jgi:hypothetical protein